MNHLKLVIQREYLTKVKNKSFIIMTILSPFIVIALFAVVGYLSQLNSNEIRTISVLDESGIVASTLKDTESTKYEILTNVSLEDAKILVEETNNYGLLHVENKTDVAEVANHIKFYSEDSPSLTLISSLENKIERELNDIRLAEQGIDVEKLRDSEIRVDIFQESYQGEKSSKIDNIVKLAFGGLAGYLLFMFIIIYGNMIMRSVIEEKTSRIIEVIISSVKPIQLMMGKIIGTSLAGVTQFAIWVVLGSILMVVVSAIFGVEMQGQQQELMEQAMASEAGNVGIQNIMNAIFNLPLLNLSVAFILFFLGGYLLYSSLYAAIGAAVDNETDTQQFLMPILIPLILAIYVGAFTVVEDPHGTVSTVFSFVPLTSPVVMLMRIPFGVPIWQQALSFAILVGTFILIVWFAAKIYRVGILMYGKKPSYKELMKWLKY